MSHATCAAGFYCPFERSPISILLLLFCPMKCDKMLKIITKFGREKISKKYDFVKPLLNFSKILFWFNFLLLLLANTTTILTLLLTTLNIFQIPLIKHTIHKIQILNRNKRKYFIPISTVLKSISHLFSKNSSDLQKNVSQTRRNSSNRQITHLLSKEER